MNKAHLALRLADELGVSKKMAEEFVVAFQEIVTSTLANDEEVTIAGFGTFSSRIRAARKGVNPRNPSEVIDVPAVKVPKFKAGKNLKDALKASAVSAQPVQAPVPVREEPHAQYGM
jgi:DNA-binding protein HU-beta